MNNTTVHVPISLMRNILKIIEERYNNAADIALIFSGDGTFNSIDSDAQEELDDLADMLADINVLLETDCHPNARD